MIINGVEFENKEEGFAYLKANKSEFIGLKKASLKRADAVANAFDGVSKANPITKSEEGDIITRAIIGNTYNWLDSHGDVHIDGCFAKSISEAGQKAFHLHDHKFETTAKVGTFKQIVEQDIKWTDLGVLKEGSTQALIGVSDIKKAYNNSIFQQYKDGDINQHSVGMYYVKIDLAINSQLEEYKEEYTTYLKYIEGIGNADKVIEQGFFWAVKEAKLVEISAVPLGSNSLTGIYNQTLTTNDDFEPNKSLNTTEPTNVTQQVNYKYITENFKL